MTGPGGVLRIPAFRRLWLALSLSSLGDWLGLLGLTALAQQLAKDHGAGFALQQYAIGGVLIVRFLPALFLGPLAGALADRLDRRITMVVCDVLRFAFLLLVPVTHSLAYLIVASFLIEVVTLFWTPAKEASVPNLLPAGQLESANRLSLLSTYGTAPVAAAVFAVLAVVSRLLATASGFFATNPTDLALFLDAGTFLVSAATVATLREIGGAVDARGERVQHDGGLSDVVRSILEGWRFVGQTRLVRGLVVGMLGAFASAGAVIALAKGYTTQKQGGNAAYGVLFGAVFAGLALGMSAGPRVFREVSRRRLFGLAIGAAGAVLVVLALVPDLVLALLLTVALGACSGLAWVTGYTLLGTEVADELRGRTFSLVGSLIRVDLLVVLAVAPFLSGAIGDHVLELGAWTFHADGITLTLVLAGALAVGFGSVAYRQMDDSPLSLRQELLATIRGRRLARRRHDGLFIALEGGDGTGKSTQAARLADWLREQGVAVVVTREPGATPTGRRLRELLLDPAARIGPRAEALLYAADRAEHVASVVRPALGSGAVVVTDRYVDSSLAYQAAGRALELEEVRHLSSWATEELLPDLTVVLDAPVEVSLARTGAEPDRLEDEPLAFHEAVRRAFLDLAAREPHRYLVLDATADPDALAVELRTAVHPLLARHGVALDLRDAEQPAPSGRVADPLGSAP